MKYWLAVFIGAFVSANAFVAGTTVWQETGSNSQARIVTGQEANVPVGSAESRANDPDQVLFEGWAAPEFALMISGRLDGYIEPCGCTGLANQKGGLLRRHTFLKQMTDDFGWKVVSIDTGNQIGRTGQQSIIKLKTTWRGLFQTMGYQISAIGVDDLKIPLVDLISTIFMLDLDKNPPFVTANVNLMGESYIEPYKIIEVAGRRIGVTAILGDEETQKLQQVVEEDVKLIPVDQALPPVIEMLAQEKCDMIILIANMSLDAGRNLAKKYPNFDVVVSSNGVGEPTNEPERIETNGRVTSLIQVGSKGMHVGVLGFFNQDGKLASRYQRVPLDARFKDSDEMKVVFKDYQTELGRQSWDELRIAPKPHPTGRKFVGSSACQDCHEYAYEIWEKGHKGPDNPKRIGPHFRATLDLTEPGERTWVTREKDPECLSCHVTGWNPQGYFPYETGYFKLADEDLHGNGCENCHGPGSMHVDAENEDIEATPEQIEQYRQEMVVTLEQARKELCMTCHDLDNSPDFHHEGAFEEYWPKIDHTEKDDEDDKGK